MSITNLLERYNKVLIKKNQIENEIDVYYTDLINELHAKKSSKESMLSRLSQLPDGRLKDDLSEYILKRK